MNINIYVIDDDSKCQMNAKEQIFKLFNDPSKFISGNKKTEMFTDFPGKYWLLLNELKSVTMSFNAPIEGYIDENKLNLIKASFLTSIREPAVLFLDWNLLGDSNNIKKNNSNFLEIIRMFSPKNDRIICITSSSTEPTAPTKYKDFIEVRGKSLKTNSAYAIALGIAKWLDSTLTYKYNSFVDELMQKGHDGTMVKTNTIPLLEKYTTAQMWNGFEDKINDTVHNLASGYPVGLDAAWILAFVAFRSIFPYIDSSTLFKTTELSQFLSAPVTKIPWFIPSQDVNDRSYTLNVFGEVCKRLFICDSSKNLKCCDEEVDSGKCALRNVTLSFPEFQLGFCFPALEMQEYLQAWTHFAAIDVRAIIENKFKVRLPQIVKPSSTHMTSGLLYALTQALTLTNEVNPGDNYLGSDVLLKIEGIQNNIDVVKTRMVFHG